MSIRDRAAKSSVSCATQLPRSKEGEQRRARPESTLSGVIPNQFMMTSKMLRTYLSRLQRGGPVPVDITAALVISKRWSDTHRPLRKHERRLWRGKNLNPGGFKPLPPGPENYVPLRPGEAWQTYLKWLDDGCPPSNDNVTRNSKRSFGMDST